MKSKRGSDGTGKTRGPTTDAYIAEYGVQGNALPQPRQGSKQWKVVRVLATDYWDYGGRVKRWEYDHVRYPDCSCGCQYWQSLSGGDRGNADWGVCLNPASPRQGLLTWEHQAGYGCFSDEDQRDGSA